MKHTLKHKLVLSVAVLLALVGLAAPVSTQALSATRFAAASTSNDSAIKCPAGQYAAKMTDDNTARSCCPNSAKGTAPKDLAKVCFFNKYVNPLISLLAALVGIVVVGSIIYGGVVYSTSGGDPQRAAKGKDHIRNALIGLVAYLLLYAFLQFLIPGGKFSV